MKKEIGERFKYIRNKHKDSLRGLAEKLNISFTTLHKIETGYNYPSIEVINKISKHYDVPHSYFFGEEKEVPQQFKDKIQWIDFGDKMEKHDLSPKEIEEMLEGFLKRINNDKS